MSKRELRRTISNSRPNKLSDTCGQHLNWSNVIAQSGRCRQFDAWPDAGSSYSIEHASVGANLLPSRTPREYLFPLHD